MKRVCPGHHADHEGAWGASGHLLRPICVQIRQEPESSLTLEQLTGFSSWDQKGHWARQEDREGAGDVHVAT